MQPRKNIWEYYDVLGLRPGASAAEVKHAYRRLVRQWHPDRFTHDPRSQRVAEEKLKEINEAYGAVSGARPAPAYIPPYQRHRPSHSTRQRTTGTYSYADAGATGQHRTATGGFRYRPGPSAYEAPNYTYREVSPRGMPRWIMVLAWFLLVSVINTISHDSSDAVKLATSGATLPAPKLMYTPPNDDVQHLADLQKQAQEAMNLIRLNDRHYRINYQPSVPLDDRMATLLQENARAQVPVENQTQGQGKDAALIGSQEKPAVRNYPVPSTNWPGFRPSLEAPDSNAPSQENTTPSPSKEKVSRSNSDQ